jgi:hypothetical protein
MSNRHLVGRNKREWHCIGLGYNTQQHTCTATDSGGWCFIFAIRAGLFVLGCPWGQFKLTVLTWMTQKQAAVPTAWLQGLSTCLPTRMWYQPGVKWWIFCLTTKAAISLRSVILSIIMTTLRTRRRMPFKTEQ